MVKNITTSRLCISFLGLCFLGYAGILRYAHNNELNLVLPISYGTNYLGQPDVFSVKMVENAPWHSLGYDIFAVHTRWNHEAVRSLIGESAVYVTMLRSPVDIFESFYSYSKLDESYNASLPDFIDKLSDRHFKLNIAEKRKYKFVGRNQMAWDFGLKPKFFENDEAIDKLIQYIDENFHLVMIAERFEESIVLFRNLMCWEDNDVTYLKLNARVDNKKMNLTNEQRSILASWLSADMKLYKYFSKKFDQLIDGFGKKRMKKQVEELLAKNKELENKCVEKIVTNEELGMKEKWYSDTVYSYRIRDSPECRYYGIKENTFLNELQAIQTARVKEKTEREKVTEN
ncbi:hypothetical protein QYM36_016865 [Artemia franciscana]|uniref:Galactosylceramide sulfotransferase n=1 Tax=Artemia franciscana TaxID=6661 RepID=A0AA88KSF7_ARTSF|nr:hypothetical protein QYM36_016865 [Artemia franciscana]